MFLITSCQFQPIYEIENNSGCSTISHTLQNQGNLENIAAPAHSYVADAVVYTDYNFFAISFICNTFHIILFEISHISGLDRESSPLERVRPPS